MVRFVRTLPRLLSVQQLILFCDLSKLTNNKCREAAVVPWWTGASRLRSEWNGIAPEMDLGTLEC